jgi:hypothetical protein
MLLQLIVVLVVLGAALYLVETYVPMVPPIKLLLRIVIVIAIIVYLFRLAGIV